MLSVVIPVYNEKDSLLPLHAEIVAVAHQARLDLEVLFVDDGSTRRLVGGRQRSGAARPSRCAAFAFAATSARRRPCRRASAPLAATSSSRLTPTCRTTPPRSRASSPRWNRAGRTARLWTWSPAGSAFVTTPGTRSGRAGSSTAWSAGLTGVKLHDHNCGMKAYRAEIFREVRLYGELHRFIPVLAAARGFRVGEIEINHRPRRFGSSKYGVRRFVKGFLDLLTVKFLTGFGQRPQHLLGTLGLGSFLLGNLACSSWRSTWLLDADRRRLVPTAAPAAAADLLGGGPAAGGADDVDRLPRRADHRLPGPRRGQLQHCRAVAGRRRCSEIGGRGGAPHQPGHTHIQPGFNPFDSS